MCAVNTQLGRSQIRPNLIHTPHVALADFHETATCSNGRQPLVLFSIPRRCCIRAFGQEPQAASDEVVVAPWGLPQHVSQVLPVLGVPINSTNSTNSTNPQFVVCQMLNPVAPDLAKLQAVEHHMDAITALPKMQLLNQLQHGPLWSESFSSTVMTVMTYVETFKNSFISFSNSSPLDPGKHQSSTTAVTPCFCPGTIAR